MSAPKRRSGKRRRADWLDADLVTRVSLARAFARDLLMDGLTDRNGELYGRLEEHVGIHTPINVTNDAEFMKGHRSRDGRLRDRDRRRAATAAGCVHGRCAMTRLAAMADAMRYGDDRGRWGLSASYAETQPEHHWKCDEPPVTKRGAR